MAPKVTGEQVHALGRRLGRHAEAVHRALRAIDGQAGDTTWTGGARHRFDHDLNGRLKDGRHLVNDVGACAEELKHAARRLDDIYRGLRADERDVRTQYPDYLRHQGIPPEQIGQAMRHLPEPLDPDWAGYARRVLGHSHTQGLM